jgi:hypothetical protein
VLGRVQTEADIPFPCLRSPVATRERVKRVEFVSDRMSYAIQEVAVVISLF